MHRNYMAGQENNKTEQSLQARDFFHSVIRPLGRGVFLLFCILTTAIFLAVSFPKLSYAGYAWIAFLPFVWGLTKIRHFSACVAYGWLTGFLFYAFTLYWIYYTCLHGGNLSKGLSLAAWWGLSGLLAIQVALFSGSCFYLKKTGIYFPLLAAFGWVAFEWIHQTVAFYTIGFPWLMLGGSQWNFPETVQLVSLTGVYGLSFCLMWCGAQLGWMLTNPSVKKIAGSMLLVLAVFFSVYSFGHYRLERFGKINKHQSLLSLQAALMQPNIDQYKKWNEAYETEIRDTVVAMGSQIAPGTALLTVWPESVAPGPLTEETESSVFEKIAVESESFQLVGSFLPSGEEQYVGAYLVAPDTDTWQIYQKIKLVPFGEFIPFASGLQKLFPDVEVLGELGSFSPGPAKQKLLELNGVLLGSTICYESIFPQLWVSQARKGAKLFVNITNDAWFFDTAAPYQHLVANVLRAVETGRPVLRAANTGFSAVINPVGTIEQKSKLFSREILMASVSLPIGDHQTFYVQWGDWFAWLCVVVFFTLLISTIVFAYE